MVVSGQALIAAVLSLLVSYAAAHGIAKGAKTVTYDGRSLIVNGRRELLFSGSIHYPRSTPEVVLDSSLLMILSFSCSGYLGIEWMVLVNWVQMWPDILQKAKHGGLNLIQTYVFWNIHEPVEGQVDLYLKSSMQNSKIFGFASRANFEFCSSTLKATMT